MVTHNSGRVLYSLQPKQYECYRLTPIGRGDPNYGPIHIGYGGAAGGGKSYLTRAVAVATALRWPGSTGIIFRETEWSVHANHIVKFWTEVPPELEGERLYRWNGDLLCATWANGSRTYFGYLKEEKDVLRYQGPEYDFMGFEEATHYSETQVSWLTGNRLRATISGSVPFCLYPSNPGGRGMQWYKRLFVSKLYRDEEDPSEFAFVKARLVDNQILMKRDPKYAKKLDRLPEPHRSWMRDGDFESGAGAAFVDMWEKKHLIRPFDLPDHWPLWGSFDWGYRHPAIFGLYTKNEDGRIFKIETLKMFRHQPHEQLSKVRGLVTRIGGSMGRLLYTVGGRDLWSERKAWNDIGPTLQEYFAANGWFIRQANQDRVQGYRALQNLLAWSTKGEDGAHGEPDLYFFKTKGNQECFDQIASMVPDDTGEDVKKVDANEFGEGGDDMYDESRYGIMDPALAPVGTPLHADAWSPEALEAERIRTRTFRGLPHQTTRPFSPEFGAHP